MKTTCLYLKFTLLLLLPVLSSHAQKLPGVQNLSVWPSADIKIDGKVTEWGDKFQVYNKATLIYYTIANDNENIYLVVKVRYPNVIDKVLRGGISLTLNHSLSKKDASAVTVTYPVLQDAEGSTVINLFNTKFGVLSTDGEDNSLNGLNQALAAKSKSIGIAGIKAIPDEEISVYNDLGIKAASSLIARWCMFTNWLFL